MASHTCPMISAALRSRWKPCFPVEQKEQSRLQPTCDDTQSVARLPSGMSTVSTRPPPSMRISHLRVPSAESWRDSTAGGRTSATLASFSRSALPRLLMRSKSRTPW